MNPNEIKKAFEEQVALIGTMSDVYLDEEQGFELYMAMRNALDYINDLEAKVERYKDNLNAVLEERADENIKSEAIKEFDEILKEDCLSCPLEAGDVTMLVDVDSYNNLVKEIVGEQNV